MNFLSNEAIVANTLIPYSLIQQELNGLYGSTVLSEMGNIIKLYDVYENGSDFLVETNPDYKQASLKTKSVRSLIDKEARFLFSRKPDFNVNVLVENEKQKELAKQQSSIIQNLIDKVMNSNNISNKLLKAAKDCFIGKRVALIANFNKEGIAINFLPSLEFIFDVSETNVDKITKLIAFYTLSDNKSKSEQRIYKKKYWLENGYCWIEEGIYDGVGNLVEEKQAATKTLFSYIPAYIIINDGLTGDLLGVSEVEQLQDFESWYSRLSNSDIDAERKGMNPITYTVDMTSNSTENLSRAAGSFWDLASDTNNMDGTKGTVGTLENSMAYSSALNTTLLRIKSNMYKLLDMPDVEEMQTQLSSGKALKSIYWGLIVRCDEKMLVWKSALEFICKTIIDGAILYPLSSQVYMREKIPTCEYEINVNNQYPLPEDELEEIQSDITKVNAQVMSKKRFMKKWEGLTDDEAMSELEQISLEREMLEDSYTLNSNAFTAPPKTPSEGQEEDI